MDKIRVKLLSFSPFTQETLAIIIRAAIVILAIITVFFQDLAIIFNDALQNETTSYVLAIPFMLTYLVYRKRKIIRAVIPLENLNQPKKTRDFPTIVGVILSIVAVLLYWRGSYTFTPLHYHMLVLPIFAFGLILIFFNTQTVRQLAFPIAFLILLTPPPLEILHALGSTLSVIGSEASYSIISSLGIPSTLRSEYGNPVVQITRPGGAMMSFAVDIACSGIYSLIGFLIFAVFLAYLIRDKLWKKLALFLIGFPLIYILNITRITLILLIGYHYGEESALQLFHLLGGWFLIFMGTLLLLFFTEKIFNTQILAKPLQKCVACNSKPERYQNFCLTCGRILRPAHIKFSRIGIVKMAATIVSVIFLISIQTPVFALTEGPAQIIIQKPEGEQGNTQLLPQIQGYTLVFTNRDRNFEEIARQDASLIYAYQPTDKTKELIWVTVEIGSPTSSLHNWEVCLISWQIEHGRPALATQLDLKDLQIQQNPPIIARYFAFQWVETNQTEVVLYWYETAKFITNGTAQQKHMKISLIAYPDTPQNITKAENLLPFATAIVKHWQPIKTWTQISLLLSQNGAYLAAIVATLLAPVTVIYALEKRKQSKSNANTYQKLSKPNKQIIDAVLETEKTTTPTLGVILTAYKNRTGENIEEEELLHKLSEAEKAGIIKSAIANNKDEPKRIWKTYFALRKRAKMAITK